MKNLLFFLSLLPSLVFAASPPLIQATAPLVLTNSSVLSIPAATGSVNGYLTSANFNTFNSKLSSPLTTKGDILGFSTVAARLAVGNNDYVLTADSTQPLGIKWAVATGGITSLNALTAAVQLFGTPGTSGVAPNWSSITATHTLNIPLASASSVTAGLISKTDYDSFAAKQAAGNYITALTGDVTASGPGSAAASISATTVTGKVLTGFSSGAGTVTAADTILQGFNKVVGNQASFAPLASPTFTGTVTAPLLQVADGSTSSNILLAVRKDVNSITKASIVNRDSGSSAYAQLSIGGADDFNFNANSLAGGGVTQIVSGSGFTSGMEIRQQGNAPITFLTDGANSLILGGTAGTYTFSHATASTVPYFDASRNLVSSGVTPTQLSYVDFTSSGQTQLNAKASLASPTFTGTVTLPTVTGGLFTDANALVASGDLTKKVQWNNNSISSGHTVTLLFSSNAAADHTITMPGYSTAVAALTGNGQTFTGTLTFSGTKTFSDLTASTGLALNSSKEVISLSATPTELNYSSGVTSAIQTQFTAKAPIASPTFTGTVTAPLLAVASGSASSSIPFAVRLDQNALTRALFTNGTNGASAYVQVSLSAADDLNINATSTLGGAIAQIVSGSGFTNGLQIAQSGIRPIFFSVNGSTTLTLGGAGTYTFHNATASTVPYFDASKNLISSGVTPTQLSYVDFTSSGQTQLNAKAPLASPTFTGYIKFGNYHVEPSYSDAGNSSTAITIDFSTAQTINTTLTTASPVITLTNGQAGGSYILQLTQDGTGGRTMTTSPAINWGNIGTPTLSTGIGKIDLVYLFTVDGTNWRGTGFSPGY